MKSLLLGFVLVLLASVQVRADQVIYSDLGPPGEVYGGAGGLFVDNWITSEVSAAAFTPTEDFNLTQIDVAMMAVGYPENQDNLPAFNIGIYHDVNGQPDTNSEFGELTGSFGIATAENSCCDLVTSNYSGVTLYAGQQYWLVASPGEQSAIAIGAENVVGATGLLDWGGFTDWAQFASPWTWGTAQVGLMPAFDVLGNPVPEPSTLVLMVMALLSMPLLWRGIRPALI